tara:strand:+ start:215 stop:457 length:243 start_codon:yes stop_codon:yes gene_type:complete
MTSTLQTFKGAFDVLVSKLQADILEANRNGTTNVSPEDLKVLFTLISAHSQTVSVNSWESLRIAIEADTATTPTKKTRKK